MTDMERRIIAAVDEQKDDLIAFFRELLQCRSFTGKEQEVAAKLIGGLRARGMEEVELVERTPGRPNVLAYYRGAEEGPTCTFNGHLDVLPPQDYASWDHPPFAADMEDGRIYGRGTVDMKGGLAASLYAAAIAKREGLLEGRTVYVTGSVCEEYCDGVCLEHFYRHSGVRPDFCVICEPSDNTITLGHTGKVQARIVTQGVSAHGSAPEKGVNAVYEMAEIIQRVEALNQDLQSLSLIHI